METGNRRLMWHGMFLFLLGLFTGCPGCHLDRSETPEPCKGDGILDSDLRYLCKLADYHGRRDFRYRSRFPDLGSRT
jgi:hypothetical protein